MIHKTERDPRCIAASGAHCCRAAVIYITCKSKIRPVVSVRFAIAEPEGRYHMPVRLTPWSYTVNRGS